MLAVHRIHGPILWAYLSFIWIYLRQHIHKPQVTGTGVVKNSTVITAEPSDKAQTKWQKFTDELCMQLAVGTEGPVLQVSLKVNMSERAEQLQRLFAVCQCFKAKPRQ